jgi:TonB family protein
MKKQLVFILLFCFSTALLAQSRNVRKLHRQGTKEMQEHNYPEAIRLLTLSIEEQGFSNAYYSRALAYAAVGDSCGFCLDLIEAFKLGDETAGSFYRQYCIYNRFMMHINDSVAAKESDYEEEEIVYFKCLPDNVIIAHTSCEDEEIFHATDAYDNTKTVCVSHRILEEMPEFPGGPSGMLEFIRQNLRYPIDARNKGIQGIVYVGFTVQNDGSISDLELREGVYWSLDVEAVRLVSIMPLWKPGKLMGKPVKATFDIPIKFSIIR